MRIDLKQIKVYLVSPANGKYRDRVTIVFNRLIDAGFHNIEFIRSQSALNNVSSLTNACLTIFKKELTGTEPFMIIEDDCAIMKNYDTIDIPDDYDTIYLGVSKWVYPYEIETIPVDVRPPIEHNSLKTIQSYNELFTKIHGMCSTHAILYRSRNYLKTFLDIVEWATSISNNLNHDLIFATIQKHFQVFAFKHPMFYQDSSIGGQEEPTRITYHENDCYY